MQTHLPERMLTRTDYVRLTRIALERQQAAEPPRLDLSELLETSDLVGPREVPADVVTMYSQVLLRNPLGGEPYQLTLCYPSDADPAEGFISVLSPAGLALLGLRVGDMARWSTPDGRALAARIMALTFQPEASGDFEL
jgi:regulator of nucleoside diphosphate kinase